MFLCAIDLLVCRVAELRGTGERFVAGGSISETHSNFLFFITCFVSRLTFFYLRSGPVLLLLLPLHIAAGRGPPVTMPTEERRKLSAGLSLGAGGWYLPFTVPVVNLCEL